MISLLWCNFFIEAYDKGIYEFAKDFLVPSVVLFLTIRYSIILSKQAINNQRLLDDEKQKEEYKAIIDSIGILNKPIIKEINTVISNLNKEKKTFNIEDFSDFNLSKFNTSFYESIINIGYSKLHSAFYYDKRFRPSDFLNFWADINNLPKHIKYIEEYISYLERSFNKVNEELYNVTHSLSIEISNLAHSEFPPNSISEIDLSTIHLYPKKYLAFQLHGIIQETNGVEVSALRRTDLLLTHLDAIRKDKISSSALTADLAQDIINAIGILNNIKKILKVAGDSYSNYIDAFTKVRDRMEVIFQLYNKNS